MASSSKNSGSSNNPIIGALVSFFLPGLGLLLGKCHRKLGVMVFVAAMVAICAIVVAGIFGTLMCFFGFLLYMAIPVIHITAAVHTYDVLQKEEGGKPIFFK